MKKEKFLNFDTFNDLYYIYLNALVGKMIKKGKKEKAFKFFNKLKENIKLNTGKKKEVPFIFFIINVE